MLKKELKEMKEQLNQAEKKERLIEEKAEKMMQLEVKEKNGKDVQALSLEVSIAEWENLMVVEQRKFDDPLGMAHLSEVKESVARPRKKEEKKRIKRL